MAGMPLRRHVWSNIASNSYVHITSRLIRISSTSGVTPRVLFSAAVPAQMAQGLRGACSDWEGEGDVDGDNSNSTSDGVICAVSGI